MCRLFVKKKKKHRRFYPGNVQYAHFLPIGRQHEEQKSHCSCDVCKLVGEKKKSSFIITGKSEIADDMSLKKRDFGSGRAKARAPTGSFCFISKNWESRSLR